MKSGFFADLALVPDRKTRSKNSKCGVCGLYKTCHSPKMKPTGQGGRSILVVAEAPGATEDETGVQLVGDAGRLLRDVLGALHVDLDDDCWKTNVIICRPPGNATPTTLQIDSCLPNLIRTIKELQPSTIISLGTTALRAILMDHEITSPVNMTTWVGWQIPSLKYNAWICPNWHPSYLLRENNSVLDLWFKRYLRKAVSIQGEPWEDGIPDYHKMVRVELDIDKAVEHIKTVYQSGKPFAFDYETDRLKPDAAGSRIVCCSICNSSKLSVSFPWHGKAIKAMRKLLLSDVGKIAANLKMEDRWTRKEFGEGVRNWVWDTMQAAHVLDNRRGITGLKFQSFIRFGVADYSSHLDRYLKTSSNGNTPNQITQIPLTDLLLYNGLDSLFTYKLAKIQRDEINVR